MQIAFDVRGPLRGKDRPRTNTKTKAIYTPRKTVRAESGIGYFANLAMRGMPLLTGPLAVDILVWVPIPKSWPKYKQRAADFVTGTPDCDNVAKTVCDALNGIVYADDSQISDLSIRRRYREGEASASILI